MFPITLNSLSISGKKQYVWCIYISALSAWKQIKVISKSYHYINIVNLFLYRESNYKTASDFKRMFMQDVRFKCININIIPLITRSDIFKKFLISKQFDSLRLWNSFFLFLISCWNMTLKAASFFVLFLLRI